MTRGRILMAATVWIFAGSGAFACAVSIAGGGPRLLLAYNPFDPAAERLAASLQVVNRGGKPCDGALVFLKKGDLGAAGAGKTTVAYDIQNPATGASLASADPGAAPLLPPGAFLAVPNLRPGEVRVVNYTVRAPAGQVIPPGAYSGAFEAVPYQGTGGQFSRAGSGASIALAIQVTAVMSVNIAGGGQSTTLDFGALSAGATRSVRLQVRSNRNFRLAASSENGGVMKLEPPAGDGLSWETPYTVRIGNGGEMSLKTEQRIAMPTAPTALGGASVPIEVKIGDASNKRAGRYKDVITVSVDAAP